MLGGLRFDALLSGLLADIRQFEQARLRLADRAETARSGRDAAGSRGWDFGSDLLLKECRRASSPCCAWPRRCRRSIMWWWPIRLCGREGVEPALAAWLEDPRESCSDLMTAFMDRCRILNRPAGTWYDQFAFVDVLSPYRKLRSRLLEKQSVHSLIHLGRASLARTSELWGSSLTTVERIRPQNLLHGDCSKVLLCADKR